MLLEWTHTLEHHSRSVKDETRDVINYRNILNVVIYSSLRVTNTNLLRHEIIC